MSPHMRSRWVDVGTIAAAIFVPMIIAALLVTAARRATSQSTRDAAETAQLLITLVWWVALLAWAIGRLVVGARGKWPSGGLRVATLAVVILLCPLGCAGLISYMPVHLFCRVLPDRQRVRYEVDHEAIAAACAAVMSKPEHFADREWDDPEFPAVLRDVRPNYITVHERGITMEMHGGFDHYGLRFQPDGADTWGLWYYTEGFSTQLVSGVRIEKQESPTSRADGTR